MNDCELARWRLQTQLLVGPPATSPADVVGGLLAVQAENYAPAAWAIATRCMPVDEKTIGSMFDRGDILRVHVLRPTWHFVLPEDLPWLVEVTAPRIRTALAQTQRTTGLDNATLHVAVDTVVAAIDSDGPSTRQQLSERLLRAGLPGEGISLSIITTSAELSTLICSGPRRDGAQTYELVSKRIANGRCLNRDEALAELAARYLRGHSPASVRDLAYWATLTLTDARTAIESIGDQLSHFDHDGRTYWHLRGNEPATSTESSAHLLQILDEIYRGYQDSRWVLDAAKLLSRTREPAIGMALINGQVTATMTRHVNVDTVEFNLSPIRPINAEERVRIGEAAEHYGYYLNRQPNVTYTGHRSRRQP